MCEIIMNIYLVNYWAFIPEALIYVSKWIVKNKCHHESL
jgi:hypothetical protein